MRLYGCDEYTRNAHTQRDTKHLSTGFIQLEDQDKATDVVVT